jgi:hypothetical protein
MLNWPEMLHHVEDWANGFWAGAASASIIGIVAAVVALISQAILGQALRDRLPRRTEQPSRRDRARPGADSPCTRRSTGRGPQQRCQASSAAPGADFIAWKPHMLNLLPREPRGSGEAYSKRLFGPSRNPPSIRDLCPSTYRPRPEDLRDRHQIGALENPTNSAAQGHSHGRAELPFDIFQLQGGSKILPAGSSLSLLG